MLNDFKCTGKVYLAYVYTDLRRGIDGLASIVEQQFHLGAFSNTPFLFCGRRKDRIKGLYWEGDGFLLLYKRLESGSFQWPRNGAEARELSAQQYRWLMEAECGTAESTPSGNWPERHMKAGKALKTLYFFCRIWYNRAMRNAVKQVNSAEETGLFGSLCGSLRV